MSKKKLKEKNIFSNFISKLTLLMTKNRMHIISELQKTTRGDEKKRVKIEGREKKN